MQNINEIEELIKLIAKLPGLGPKSAKRIVLKLINNRDELVKPMANTLAQVYKNVVRCQSCGTLKSNSLGCNNCENTKKKYNKICVVEDIADQWSIENSNIYKGYFHILGGTISSPGQRKEDLLINSLAERVVRENIEEVILATSATVEGQTTAYYIQDSLKKTSATVEVQTTAYYIQDSLKKTSAKITKLAQGLPVGGEIESLDDGTLYSAFKNRSGIKTNSD
jgi:recombination protein RecR